MIKNPMLGISLDEEEQTLADSLEKGEWKTVAQVKEEVALAKQAATNTLRKDQRVNIRISKSDLNQLRQKAAYKGLPYQTLISSILHEYAAGHFDRASV